MDIQIIPIIAIVIIPIVGFVIGWIAARRKAARELSICQKEYSAKIDKLKRDIEQYSAILDESQILVWVRDADMKIIYCNKPYAEAVEYSADSHKQGEDIPELYISSAKIAKRVRSRKEPHVERRHLIINGKRRYFEITDNYLPEFDLTKGVAIDITELDDARRELNQQKLAQANMIESSSSAIAFFDGNMNLRFYNQAYVRMWGLDERWLDTNPKYGELLEHFREKRVIQEQANFQTYKKQQLKMFTDLIEPEESLQFLPDGRTIRCVIIPNRNDGLIMSFEDVTDRLALESSYNTLIAVQRETIEKLHEGVVVFGEDGRLRLSNPEFYKIWRLDEKDLPEGAHYSKFLSCIQSLIQSGDDVDDDTWDRYKRSFISNIQSREVHSSCFERGDGVVLCRSFVPLPDGGTLITYQDITDSTLVERSLREKNEALQAADRVKTEFLANMSYELRSPLTSISGFAEMLSANYFGELNEKQREYVEGISNSATHLIRLIGDILDLSSIEAGYLKLNIKEFEIRNTFESVLLLIKERLKEENITTKVDCPEDMGVIKGDETRLRQVLFHLLSNAIKYSASGTTITLGAKREEGMIHLWVEDQGVGISEQEQKKIFNKFYKGKAGSSKSGSGLGLSMVHSFIELHNGRVVVESELGKGTKVICIIPEDCC